MKYLGYLTGKVYDEDEGLNAKECVWPISDKTASDERAIRLYHVVVHMNCNLCPAGVCKFTK